MNTSTETIGEKVKMNGALKISSNYYNEMLASGKG